MSRPNAFGVIERVLDLQDSLTEAHRRITEKDAHIRTLQDRVFALEKEITGLDSILQQSITEKRLLQEKIEGSSGILLDPDVVGLTTSGVYSGEAPSVPNERT